LKKQGFVQTQIVTDRLESYHKASRALGMTAEHIDNKRFSNRAENSHLKQYRAKALGVWENASAAG